MMGFGRINTGLNCIAEPPLPNQLIWDRAGHYRVYYPRNMKGHGNAASLKVDGINYFPSGGEIITLYFAQTQIRE